MGQRRDFKFVKSQAAQLRSPVLTAIGLVNILRGVTLVSYIMSYNDAVRWSANL